MDVDFSPRYNNMNFEGNRLTRLELQRKRLIFTGTNGPVLNAIRRNVRQQLEAKTDAEYWKILTSVINLLRDPVNEQT